MCGVHTGPRRDARDNGKTKQPLKGADGTLINDYSKEKIYVQILTHNFKTGI